MTGNSTQKCALLMKRFIQLLHPDITVVNIHSDTNVFRYDENIWFVQKELMPCIQFYRDAHAKGLEYPDEFQSSPPSSTSTSTTASQHNARMVDDSAIDYSQNTAMTSNKPFSTEWRKSFSVTLSFADGSPARNHAIQAAVRSYRPMYFHFWQLKTFWHESKIVHSDIEVHSFEEMETTPAIEASQITNPITKLVVDEIKAFQRYMTQVLQDNNNDIQSFWLRKTHKPVLAVLAVQTDPSSKPNLYRGTNMEVSMPTGSLCAERNVIGTALAENPNLKREDLKMIAVLAVPLPPSSTATTPIQRSLHRQGSSSSLKRSPSTIEITSSSWEYPNLPPLAPTVTTPIAG